MTDSNDKRTEYQRRITAARRAGGRPPGEGEWNDLLGKATEVAGRRATRLHALVAAEAKGDRQSPSDGNEPMEFLLPGHIAVHADTVLGLEVELNDLRYTRANVEEHRLQLLALIARAGVLPGPGDLDVFALERQLSGVEPIRREAQEQCLEIVREVIRWRGAAKQGGG